jgi:hypothetical protein
MNLRRATHGLLQPPQTEMISLTRADNLRKFVIFPALISDIWAFFDIGKLYMKVHHTNSDCQEILIPVFQACW